MITIFRRVLFAAIISAALFSAVGLAYSDQKNEDPAATIEENLKAGRIPEAETQAQKFLQQAREKYGENDKQTLHAKLLLANVYRDAGKFAEASALIQSCLAANEKAFGPDDPSLVEPLAALGMLMQVQNKLPEAESAFRRALAIDAKNLDQSYAHH